RRWAARCGAPSASAEGGDRRNDCQGTPHDGEPTPCPIRSRLDPCPRWVPRIESPAADGRSRWTGDSYRRPHLSSGLRSWAYIDIGSGQLRLLSITPSAVETQIRKAS